MNPHHPPPDPDPPAGSDPLARIEATLHREVADAHAMEPLVEEARTVQQQVRTRLRRALPLLLLVVIGATLIGSGVYKQLNMETLAREHQALTAWAGANPATTALMMVLGIAVVISTGLPGSVVLIVAGGVVFGPVLGALLAATGDLLGGLVLFYAARRLFHGEGATPPALVERIRSGFQRNPISFAFFLRMVPVFPYGAVSVALAWLDCRWPLFVAASWLGVVPSSVIYCAIGSGLGDALASQQAISVDILREPKFLVPLLALGGLALLPVALGLKRAPRAPRG